MPADRVFGFIEKEVKNKEVILDPSEYRNIYERYGVVTKLGVDCKVKDWKTYGSEVMMVVKPPAQYHFKFNECKRYYVTGVKNKPRRFLLRGEVKFEVRDVAPLQVNVSALKLIDVNKLLCKHFGDNWKTELGSSQLKFYKNVLDQTTPGEGENEEPCEYMEEIGICVLFLRKTMFLF